MGGIFRLPRATRLEVPSALDDVLGRDHLPGRCHGGDRRHLRRALSLMGEIMTPKEQVELERLQLRNARSANIFLSIGRAILCLIVLAIGLPILGYFVSSTIANYHRMMQ